MVSPDLSAHELTVQKTIRTHHVFQRVCWHVHFPGTGNRLLPNDGATL